MSIQLAEVEKDIITGMNELIRLSKGKVPFTDYLEEMDYTLATKPAKAPGEERMDEISSIAIRDGREQLLVEVNQVDGDTYGQITHLYSSPEGLYLILMLHLRIYRKALDMFYPGHLRFALPDGKMEVLVPATEDNLSRLEILRDVLFVNGMDLIHELTEEETVCKITIGREGTL